MKSTVDQLSANEKQALALFYETDGYKAFKHFCELDILGLGRDALVAQTMEAKEYLRGKAHMAEYFPKLIRQIHKDVNKEG